MTQQELGERTGLSFRAVSAAEKTWERTDGRGQVFADLIMNLAIALGVPSGALFLPPAEDGTDARYLYHLREQDPDCLTMADLMAKVMPDSDDDTHVMDDYRQRLTVAVGRYMDPSWSEEAARWLQDMTGAEITRRALSAAAEAAGDPAGARRRARRAGAGRRQTRGRFLMAYYRKLPSGKWQATVRGRDGSRHTATDPLKSVVKHWAAQQEAAIARGEFRDPRLGDTKVADWYARVSRARVLEGNTKAKHLTLWRTHCEPQWGRWQLAAVTRLEAQEWVNTLTATRRARHRGRPVTGDDEDVPALAAETVCAAVHLMPSLYSAAMREHPPLVLVNPFASLDLPRIERGRPDFLERDEAEALYAAVEDVAGPGMRVLVELGTEVGLRPGELYGLHGHRVDWLRGRLQVVDVMTRHGLRQYPKSKKSCRVMPVPGHVMEGMSALMTGRPLDSLVSTAPMGGPVTDGHFRNRVWYPAVVAAGIRRFAPRVMRHTAASWLVMDGVPLYDVQALLGHESYRTTERYAHLAPDAHSKVIESWARRPDARVTHGRMEERS